MFLPSLCSEGSWQQNGSSCQLAEQTVYHTNMFIPQYICVYFILLLINLIYYLLSNGKFIQDACHTMNSRDLNNKYKRPKKKTHSTTNPELQVSYSFFVIKNLINFCFNFCFNKIIFQRPKNHKNEVVRKPLEPLCPLLAKDSEWVDILQTPGNSPESTNVSEEEAVLQLVNARYLYVVLYTKRPFSYL